MFGRSVTICLCAFLQFRLVLLHRLLIVAARCKLFMFMFRPTVYVSVLASVKKHAVAHNGPLRPDADDFMSKLYVTQR